MQGVGRDPAGRPRAGWRPGRTATSSSRSAPGPPPGLGCLGADVGGRGPSAALLDPLVERALRLEVDERIDHTGEVLVPLDERSVEAATRQLLVEGVEAIAVCLLHSYRNASHERRVGEIVRALAPGLYVSLSCEVLP